MKHLFILIYTYLYLFILIYVYLCIFMYIYAYLCIIVRIYDYQSNLYIIPIILNLHNSHKCQYLLYKAHHDTRHHYMPFLYNPSLQSEGYPDTVLT